MDNKHILRFKCSNKLAVTIMLYLESLVTVSEITLIRDSVNENKTKEVK